MNFYESPVFIELLLIAIYVLLLTGTVLAAWSALRSLRLRNRRQQKRKGAVGSSHIAWGVGILLLLTMGGTWLLADTTPVTINGQQFEDTFWLKASDMLINTSIILIVVALICMALGMMGMGRKK